jgi:hypothetical protein
MGASRGVEGAESLLPRFEERVATIPTTKGKLDVLANAAGMLQAQINNLGAKKASFTYVNAIDESRVKTLNNHADALNATFSEPGLRKSVDSCSLLLMEICPNWLSGLGGPRPITFWPCA